MHHQGRDFDRKSDGVENGMKTSWIVRSSYGEGGNVEDTGPRTGEPAPLTARQRIVQELMGTLVSVNELAGRLGKPEREIEEHLPHIAQSLSRDPERRLVMEPAACLSCRFQFRGRARVKRPSRCPRCRSESISPPRYGIEEFRAKDRKARPKPSRR